MEPTPDAAANSTQASQFSDLPPALLTRILQAVPQQERLSSCATICTAWAASAAAATVEVDLSVESADAIAPFQSWLEQRAGQLVSLRLKLLERMCGHLGSPLLQITLPCTDLQQLSRLDLAGVGLPLGSATDGGLSSSSSTATAAMLPKLKVLKLQDCINTCTLPALAQLSGLTRFKLVVKSRVGHAAQLEQAALQNLLQGLPKLAHLSLGRTADLPGLIQFLPADSLTALTLGFEYARTLTQLPGSASRLVNLRKLNLDYVQLHPVVLSSMTLLTRLQLQECGMDAGSTPVFLAAVRGLRQLQHLSLVSQGDQMDLVAAHPRDYAALTAASQLTYLEVVCYEAPPLPATAVQHMFPSGKQFPQLQQLSIACYNSDDDSVGPVTTAELRGIISACPALCGFEIGCVLKEDVDVSVLLQLPATCCSLKVGGKPFGDDAAGVVAQLTQLTRLEWIFAPGLTDAGLQPLTALSALQAFKMYENHNLSEAVVKKDFCGMSEELELVAAEQSVSQQLRELLLSTPTNATWLTRVEQQQQELAEQQDRLRALSCFTAQLADVLMFCAGNTDMMVTVRRMADIGRSLLVGGDVEAGDDHGALQRYLQLQGLVLEFCASCDGAAAALASMEAAVKRAVGG